MIEVFGDPYGEYIRVRGDIEKDVNVESIMDADSEGFIEAEDGTLARMEYFRNSDQPYWEFTVLKRGEGFTALDERDKPSPSSAAGYWEREAKAISPRIRFRGSVKWVSTSYTHGVAVR